MATKRRLAVFLFLIYALCFFFISTAIAFGRGLPSDNLHVLMPERFCELPCLLNITPGETQHAAALSQLSPLSNFPIDQGGTIWSFQLPDDGGNPISGTVISNDGGVVEYIRLYTRRWAGLGVQLGDLMQDERMQPTMVYRSCSGTFPVRLLFTFAGNPRISFAAIIDDSVTPYDPVSLIDVSTNDEYFPQTLSTLFGGGCYLPFEWQGFASTWRYGEPSSLFPN
jgi:hypothetical protein